MNEPQTAAELPPLLSPQAVLDHAAEQLADTYPDPAGLPLADVRPIRDDIDARVRRLLAELTSLQENI